MPPSLDLESLPEPPKIEEKSKKGLLGKFFDKKEKSEMPEPPALMEPPRVVEIPGTVKPEPKMEEIPPPPMFNMAPIPDVPKISEAPQTKKGLFSMFKKEKTPVIKQEIPAMPELPPLPEMMPEPAMSDVAQPAPTPFMAEASKPMEPVQTDPEQKVFTPIEMPEAKIETFVSTEVESAHPDIHKEITEPDAIPEDIPTPLTDLKGVGEKTALTLKKKLKVNSAEELAEHDHEHVAKKTKIPKAKAKAIIEHAKRIAKAKIKKSVKKEKSSIADLIEQLDTEKKELARLKKEGLKDLPEVKGHDDILKLLERLEKKKLELIDYENKLKDKEGNLHSVSHAYKRDAEYLDSLKRRLDHDVRERTQYLINLEKEFFNRGQELSKRQSKVELKEQELSEKEKFLKENETDMKKRQHELEDREITLNAKENQLKKLMKELDRQEELLKKKEKELAAADEKYMKRIEALEKHEKDTNKLLDEKKAQLEARAKELKKKDHEISKKERAVDIEDRALDYAQTNLENERQKLEDDEFRQYLHEKLGVMKETGITVGDIGKAKEIKVPDLTEKPQTVYDLVDKCRHLLKLGRTQEAKIFYNQIREKFYKLSFVSAAEKENLHNTVRALYDEINLAELNK